MKEIKLDTLEMTFKNVEAAIFGILQKLRFQLVSRLASGLLFSNSGSEIGLIIDIGISGNADLNYIDYTGEQNELMSRYKRLLRFAIECQTDIEQISAGLEFFLSENDDAETKCILKRGREETHPDPTRPELEFETSFATAFGEQAMYALHREKAFPDFDGKTRFIDYALVTKNGSIAIELNGESFHHPRCIGIKKYRSQLFKQNSLIMSGWKVFRWSLRGMQDKERFIEEMRRFFGPSADFCQAPQFLGSRQLGIYDVRKEYAGSGGFQLMEHQEQALVKIQQDREAGKNTFLLLFPTGTGKTEIFAEDFRRLKEKSPLINALVLVPTNVLRINIVERLKLRLPQFEHDTIYQLRSERAGFMIQTYQHMIRHYEQFEPNAFDYIVVDEAHHAAAPGMKTVLEHFQPANLIGATATDERLDAKPLEAIFGSYETNLTLQEAIEKGLLPPIRVFRVQSNVDLSCVRYNGRDYVQSDLQKTLLVRSRNELVVDVIQRYFGSGLIGKKQGVVFCVNVQHAKTMASILNQRGISASYVSGQDRKASEIALNSYHNSEIRFLCACDLLTEGWDAPQTSIVVMARPTMSKVLYQQQLGRGTRHYPGKEALYVLDIVDSYGSLNIPWSVHALFNISQYQPWGTLVGSSMNEVREEQAILLNWLHEEERRITEINIFTFQKQYENYLNEELLARELFVSTGTVKSWLRKGEIKADVEVPFGAGFLRYFDPKRIDSIRQSKNLQVHDVTTQYQDFFEFLNERDYTFSYKMIFLLSVLTLQNSRGEVKLADLTRIYQAFYEDRLQQKLPADRQNCPYNNQLFLADLDLVTNNILANPFEKFERKRFMHHCKELAVIAWNSGLWKNLKEGENDIRTIYKQMAEDLKKYYAPLNGLGDVGFLCKAFPKVLEYFVSEEVCDRALVPMVEYNEFAAFRTILPYYSLKIAAGSFISGEALQPEGWVDVEKIGVRKRLSKGMFVTQVIGKSMEPTIKDGSYCVFRHPVEGSRQGLIVLVQKRNFTDPETGGTYTVKRYRSVKSVNDEGWKHEIIELVPDNKDREKYPILKFIPEDDADMQTIAEFMEVLDLK